MTCFSRHCPIHIGGRLSVCCAGTICAGEIVAHFDIAQPSISRHLDVLKKAELVTTERRGNQIIYALNLSAIQELLFYTTELLEGGTAKGAVNHDTASVPEAD